MIGYLAFGISFIISLVLLLLNRYFFNKKIDITKIITFIAIIVFTARLFCYKSIIAESPDNFIGLSSSPLASKTLTAFSLVFIWLEYSCVLLTLCRRFFNINILSNMVKFIAPFVFIFNVALLNPICLILQGVGKTTLLNIIYGIEIGLGLGLSINYFIQDFKQETTKKDIGFMFLSFVLLSVATMPSYFLQYMFGTPAFTNSWVFKGFTPYHRIVLYGSILVPLALFYFLKNKSEEYKRFILIFICLSTMVVFVVNYSYETFVSPWKLPFHLCNTALFILPLVLIFKMKRLFYFTYFINVVGALLAMLMPNYADATNIFSMRFINFWSNHYIALFMPILIVALDIFKRPKLKQFIHSMVAFLVYFIIVLFFNVLFTAHGHEVDYFFINSDYIADKLGLWAEKLFEVNAIITIKGVEYEFRPLYQTIFFIVYIFIGLAVWFVYEEAYKFVDSNEKLFKRIKKIRIDEYALKAALNGRELSEPMEKDAGIKYELKHFSKKYATSKKYAVQDANFLVKGGEIFGFLGPNGAGKSTIIKSTVGIQPISEGNINICGYDVATQPVEAKSKIGYVPDHYALYEKLTGREYINYIADIYNVSKEDRDIRMEKYVKLFQLESSIDSMIKTYSHGMKQKITIMSALIHNPKVWILDEPLTGLDPNSIYQVKECMKDHASHGNIVFFSSHLIDIVEKLCQRIAIIKHGQILCIKSVEEIEASGETLEQFYLRMING